MAKESKKPKSDKPPGALSQMWSVYKMTAKHDKTAVLWSVLSFLLVLGGFIGFTAWLFPGNIVNLVVFIIIGTLFGLLVAMFVMSRKAEHAAYSRIEGQMGAVGAVLGQLKKGWRSSQMPVAISPRSQDAVYRAVGPAGVVLIGEGSRPRIKIVLEDERRKVNRVAPGASVSFIYVTNDAESTKLADLNRTIYKMKRTLKRGEIALVGKRLESLGMNIPIPKGIDPTKLGKMRRG